MTTCTFDGKFSTDGDDARNWVDAKMPKEGDCVRICGDMQSWLRQPANLDAVTIMPGAVFCDLRVGGDGALIGPSGDVLSDRWGATEYGKAFFKDAK